MSHLAQPPPEPSNIEKLELETLSGILQLADSISTNNHQLLLSSPPPKVESDRGYVLRHLLVPGQVSPCRTSVGTEVNHPGTTPHKLGGSNCQNTVANMPKHTATLGRENSEKK